jgi:ketosteroid isomerase-like protein
MSELPAIQNQINRYTDAVNRHDWAVFPAIYARDATWEGLGLKLKFEGLVAITKGLSEIVEAMVAFVQMNSPAVIEVSGDRAFARSTIHEHWDVPAEGTRTDIYGRYEDELVKIDGQWMFRARRFHPISRRTIKIDG